MNDCGVYYPRTPRATLKEHLSSHCAILLFVNESRTPNLGSIFVSGQPTMIKSVICMFSHVRRVCIFGVLYSKPGGVTPLHGLYSMCGLKRYGFSAVLVINWVSLLAILPPFWS